MRVCERMHMKEGFLPSVLRHPSETTQKKSHSNYYYVRTSRTWLQILCFEKLPHRKDLFKERLKRVSCKHWRQQKQEKSTTLQTFHCTSFIAGMFWVKIVSLSTRKKHVEIQVLWWAYSAYMANKDQVERHWSSRVKERSSGFSSMWSSAQSRFSVCAGSTPLTADWPEVKHEVHIFPHCCTQQLHLFSPLLYL